MQEPLQSQRFMLPFKGVLLQCLDENQEPIDGAFASGFLMREADGLFLYTCWHVVTGFDPYDIRVGFELPRRRSLRIALQDAQRRQEGVEVVGGVTTRVLPLYKNSQPPFEPIWYQDDLHVAHAELNAIGLFVPFWHDAVKLRLPDDLHPSDIQIISPDRIRPGNSALISPGDKCLIVGYPYGFSAYGHGQPTPITLTRFVAATKVHGRHQQFLLESIGAPGMSGGPVFIERDQDLFLTGLYSGAIFPDSQQHGREKVTALGTVSDLSITLWGHLALVNTPSQKHDPGAASQVTPAK